MQSQRKGFFLGLIAAGLLAAGEGGAQEKKYGKHLVAEYRIPVEVVEKYAEFKPSGPKPGENKIEAVLFAKTEEWSGDFFDAKAAGNPYNIVVTLTGTAKADGDALTMWHAGWKLNPQESVHNALSGLSKLQAKAGERFTVTAVARPTSFKEDRNVAPLLGFVRSSNVEIRSVDVAVWSGMPKASWLETLFAFKYLMVGLAAFGAVWWLRRRRE